jgi:tRNA dimethylallyltransferase
MFEQKSATPYVLVISGPTACGKTALSQHISSLIPSEIINADVGQFYTPLCIGTAKPDWQTEKTKHHLFDIIDEPRDLTVVEYRTLVTKKINDIWQKGKLPIIVGGSLFYIKSLYFPPKAGTFFTRPSTSTLTCKTQDLWQTLYNIDPERAAAIHPNDVYRIKRAIEIWEITGIKPSAYKPEYAPGFHSLFVFIYPLKKVLYESINARTACMIQKGWIEETKRFVGTPWQDFLKTKGLIGYDIILEWIEHGEKKDILPEVIIRIQQETRQYAKRQVTFWKSLKNQLEHVVEIDNPEDISFLDSKFFVEVKRSIGYNS